LITFGIVFGYWQSKSFTDKIASALVANATSTAHPAAISVFDAAWKIQCPACFAQNDLRQFRKARGQDQLGGLCDQCDFAFNVRVIWVKKP
jgi:hypothetical protein